MQPVPRLVADKFALQFAGSGRGSGLSAKEITDFFGKYSNLVRSSDHYGMLPTKKILFINSLYDMQP